MLAIHLLFIAFIMYKASIPSFIRAFIMKWCWILSKAFPAFIEIIVWFFCSLLLLIGCIHLMISVCWTISASLGWSQLEHYIWSFWYVVEFSSPVFYWEFLHLSSLKRLAINSLNGTNSHLTCLSLPSSVGPNQTNLDILSWQKRMTYWD
jgi:hypothetical protein